MSSDADELVFLRQVVSDQEDTIASLRQDIEDQEIMLKDARGQRDIALESVWLLNK